MPTTRSKLPRVIGKRLMANNCPSNSNLQSRCIWDTSTGFPSANSIEYGVSRRVGTIPICLLSFDDTKLKSAPVSYKIEARLSFKEHVPVTTLLSFRASPEPITKALPRAPLLLLFLLWLLLLG